MCGKNASVLQPIVRRLTPTQFIQKYRKHPTIAIILQEQTHQGPHQGNGGRDGCCHCEASRMTHPSRVK
jgi:hypothetical protein